MKTTEARSIQEIDEQRWDAVTGDVLSMTHRWLRVIESCWRPYEPRYLFLEDDQGPCVAAVADTSASVAGLGLAGWLYQRLSLAVRPTFSSMCGVMVRPGLSIGSVLPELEPLLTGLCRRERRLLITVSNVDASNLSGWQQAGFLAARQPGTSVMDLPATYDQYFGALQRKNRQELRRARRRGADLDARFEFGPLAGDGEQIYSLVCEVFASHGTARKAMPFAPQFLAALERELPGEVLFLRGYLGETLAGVCLCLLNGTTFWAPMMGLHYETARSGYLYFLMQDEMVRWSIEHGMRKIFVGKTNERVKQRHGFHQEECWFCYRAGPGALNRMLALASPLIERLIRG